jgi:hypothetical protein
MDTYDSTVINCLQDFNSEIKNTECKRLVKKYIVLASEDIRFDVPLAEACADDRQKFCSAVAPVCVGHISNAHGIIPGGIYCDILLALRSLCNLRRRLVT